MIYSDIKTLNVKPSRLGFGCMRFPTQADGKIDRDISFKMIDTAYKAGVNYFDTAYGYHGGESELFTGEALKRYPRDSFMLADKLPTWLLKTADDPMRLFNEQLGKCQVEYFDFYLLHALNKERWVVVKETGALDRMLEMKKQGKIRNLGFSYHGEFEDFVEIMDAHDWDFVQIQINYMDYTMMDSKAYHDKLNAKGVPCVVMEPVRGGFLAQLPAAAHDHLAAVNGDSDATWALRWCLEMENMPIILSGMSSPEQVADNLRTFDKERPMTAAETKALNSAKEAILAVETIPCTACGYCMDCSFGVNIPGVFSAYNHLQMFQNPTRSQEEYNFLSAEHNADVCVQCGACAPMCPQGIDIPAQITRVQETFAAL